ncbi:MAG: ABC transporter permease, partial [Candidatus Brocadiia bacterium]
MSIFKLVKRSILFYWRSNLGILLAVLVSTAVLTGALLVGDSVRYSLSKTVTERLGSTEFSLFSQDRFFRQQLADDMAKQLDTNAASLIQLRAMASNGDGSIRANSVQVLGVDESFFKIGSAANPFGNDKDEAVVLNRQLAEKIQVRPGDEIVLRIAKPGVMSGEIPLTPDSDLTTAFRLNVKSIADESAFGRFNLQANHIPPFNVFVPIKWLQEKIGRKGKANTLLIAQDRNYKIDLDTVNQAIKSSWQLSDTALELRELKKLGFYELYSDRVFIDPPLSKAAEKAGNDAAEILTYFINELKLNDRTTPYSMVSAVSKSLTGLIYGDITDADIIINQWLADDLGAKNGDMIELAYFIVGPMRKLVEQKRSFLVRAIIPIEGLAADTNLMPDFPGISDVNNCRDWEPGIPVKLDRIRKKDEDYWDKYKGTPKAFVTISAGKSMWQNRYGDLTAVRYPLKDNTAAEISANILTSANPASIGLFFQPVRRQGLKAGTQGTDFGQLFIGFSFLIVTAAVILTGLIFVFGVETRAEQVGMLLAIGLTKRLIKRLLLLEGFILAFIGAVLGVIAGLLYTKAMIFGLATIWRIAVSGADIKFYANPLTMLIGGVSAVVISLSAVWLTLRSLQRKPARELLSGQLKWQFFGAAKQTKLNAGLLIATISAAAAVILLITAAASGSKTMAGAFFGAGTLLLIAGLAVMHYILARIQHGLEKPMNSLRGLSLRNSTRRLGRSLTVTGLLACGVFLVVSVGANRQNPLLDADKRASGTGGFALFAESSVAILHDLNSPEARKKLGLDEKQLEDADFVQLRVHQGDQASCFNLNRAQQPQLIGVQPDLLKDRNAFLFTRSIENKNGADGWDLL